MNDHMGLVPMSAEITMFYTEFMASLDIAKSQERDRIIKLLEGEKFKVPEGINQGITYVPIEQVIALLRGENK